MRSLARPLTAPIRAPCSADVTASPPSSKDALVDFAGFRRVRGLGAAFGGSRSVIEGKPNCPRRWGRWAILTADLGGLLGEEAVRRHIATVPTF
jgi:hypothetical protein